MSIEENGIDVSTHIHKATAAPENTMHGLALEANTRHDMNDAPTQTCDVAVSKNHNTSISKRSPPRMEAVVGNTSPALEHSIEDTSSEGEAETNGVICNNGTSSEATLIDSPSESLSPSLPQQEYGEEQTYQEDLLRAEEAAHWETREELSRIDSWCNSLEDVNTQLQLRVEDAERENRRIQRQLNDAEDKSTGLQTRLSGAERRIQALTNSIKVYVSVIQGLQAQVVGLNADVSQYFQLGTYFYVRLHHAGKFLTPYDGICVEYRRLMSDAAQYFRIPANGADRVPSNGNVFDDGLRIEELDEIDDNEEDESSRENDLENEQESDQETYLKNDGARMLEDGKVTCDNVPASKPDAIRAEDSKNDVTAFPHHPMRPGTANRVPISAFSAITGRAPRNSSSSISDVSAPRVQQAPTAPDSALPRATPPHQQYIYIPPIPTQCIEEQPQSSVKASSVTVQAGHVPDQSLISAGLKLIQSTNTEAGLREARAGEYITPLLLIHRTRLNNF